MPAYPFKEERLFTLQLRQVRWFTHRVVVLAVALAATVLLGVSSGILMVVLGEVLKQSFRRSLDQPWRRPRRFMIVGGVLALVTVAPFSAFHYLNQTLMNFGDQATGSPWSTLMLNVLIGIGPGLFLGGLLGGLRSVEFSYATQAFLTSKPPSRAMVKRSERNKEIVAAGGKTPGQTVQFGVVEHDKMAWRAGRYGMIVERPMGLLGHGIIVGANGSGKTFATVNLVYSVLAAGAGCLYVDLKDSRSTRDLLTKAAVKAGRPVTTLSMSERDNATWFDPLLDDDFTPMEKASMVYQSLLFNTFGDAAFYAQTSQTWLQYQFTALAHVGRAPGEGTFDFLLRTATPAGMREAIETAGMVEAPWAKKILATIDTEKQLVKELRNLRNQLENTVNGAGHLLRPNGRKMLDLRDAEREGSMVYVGLSGTADQEAMKLLGSVTLRYIALLVSRRLNARTGDMRDVFVPVDEAGFLEERGEAFEGLFKQSREAKYWMWPASQSLNHLPESTVNAIMSNASTRLVLRLNEEFTATLISKSTQQMYVVESMMQTDTHVGTFGEQNITASSSGRRSVLAQPNMLTPADFLDLPDFHAYVLFNLSDDRNPGSNKKDSAVMEKWTPAHPVGRRTFHDDNKGDAPMIALVPLTLPSESDVHQALNPTLANNFDEYIEAGRAPSQKQLELGDQKAPAAQANSDQTMPLPVGGSAHFDPSQVAVPDGFDPVRRDDVLPTPDPRAASATSGPVGSGQLREVSADELARLQERMQGSQGAQSVQDESRAQRPPQGPGQGMKRGSGKKPNASPWGVQTAADDPRDLVRDEPPPEEPPMPDPFEDAPVDEAASTPQKRPVPSERAGQARARDAQAAGDEGAAQEGAASRPTPPSAPPRPAPVPAAPPLPDTTAAPRPEASQGDTPPPPPARPQPGQPVPLGKKPSPPRPASATESGLFSDDGDFE